MRSELEIKGSFIFKHYPASLELQSLFLEFVPDYQAALAGSGFSLAETTVLTTPAELILRQEFISATATHEFTRIGDLIWAFDYSRGGLDANPGNFIFAKSGQVYFIDYFPLLIDQERLLELQFEYPVDTVRRRYFQRENVLACYLNRLFLKDFSVGLIAEQAFRDRLGSMEAEVLAREQKRLETALSLANNPKRALLYQQFYATSKTIE